MFRIPRLNFENHQNLSIPCQNHENHEIYRIPNLNKENHETLIIPRQNYENHEIPRIPCQKSRQS